MTGLALQQYMLYLYRRSCNTYNCRYVEYIYARRRLNIPYNKYIDIQIHEKKKQHTNDCASWCASDDVYNKYIMNAFRICWNFDDAASNGDGFDVIADRIIAGAESARALKQDRGIYHIYIYFLRDLDGLKLS